LDPAAANLHDGGGDVSDLNLPNMDHGASPRGESGQDASAANVDRTADDASRGCHVSPDLELF